MFSQFFCNSLPSLQKFLHSMLWIWMEKTTGLMVDDNCCLLLFSPSSLVIKSDDGIEAKWDVRNWFDISSEHQLERTVRQMVSAKVKHVANSLQIKKGKQWSLEFPVFTSNRVLASSGRRHIILGNIKMLLVECSYDSLWYEGQPDSWLVRRSRQTFTDYNIVPGYLDMVGNRREETSAMFLCFQQIHHRCEKWWKAEGSKTLV